MEDPSLGVIFNDGDPEGLLCCPVVQVFKGGIVMVQGHGLVLSVIHLLLLTIGSPFMFTVLIVFFADTFQYVVWYLTFLFLLLITDAYLPSR